MAAGVGRRGGEDIVCSGNTFVVGVCLAGGRVAEAWSTGKMMHNPDVILAGTLSRDGSPDFATRACCICNDGHALAAVRALEDLTGATPPRNARLVRSLVQAGRCIQDHVAHVYQFHLSDWVHLDRALRADPARAARLDENRAGGAEALREARERLLALAQGEGGGLRGLADCEHPAYRGEDELHLLLHCHGLESLTARAALARALMLLGCTKSGHLAYAVGGLSPDLDLGATVREELRVLFTQCRDFVLATLLPDLARLARTYADWAHIGRFASFLAWGDMAQPAGEGRLFPNGVFTLGQDGPLSVCAADPAQVELTGGEPWSAGDADHYRLRFGEDGPCFRWSGEGFTWLDAPRHGGAACEAGPTARVLGLLARGQGPGRDLAEAALDRAGLPASALNSTLGRLVARGVESLCLAETALGWLDALDRALAAGDDAVRQPGALPAAGEGLGLVEVPRGALLHRLRLDGTRVVSHDYLIPSLWNFSPRSADGARGPLEQALLGTPVADPARPLEVLRTVHALDPCNACVVRVEDADSGQTVTIHAK